MLCSQAIDLIILEGMGRAVHTNFSTKFTCDCAKLAIIKNGWLARRLGGDMFSLFVRLDDAVDS